MMFGNFGSNPFAMPQGALPPQNLYQQPMPRNPMPVPSEMMQPPAPQPSPFGGSGMNNFAPILAGIGAALTTGNASSYIPAFSSMYNRQQDQRAFQGEEARKRAEKNKTYQYLQRTDPEAAEMFASGAMSAKDALQWSKDRNKKPASAEEFEYMQGLDGKERRQYRKLIGGGGTTINNMGNIPAGYEQYKDPKTGARQMRPIPGSPAALEQEAALRKRELGSTAKQNSANFVLDEIDIAQQLIQQNPSTTTGVGGKVLSTIDQTTAGQVKNRLTTIKANIGFDKLQAMRDASPNGSALGQVTEFENRLLQAGYGSLEQAQTSEDLLYNLERLKSIYSAIVNEGIDDETARQMYREEVLGGASRERSSNGVRRTRSGVQWKVTE